MPAATAWRRAPAIPLLRSAAMASSAQTLDKRSLCAQVELALFAHQLAPPISGVEGTTSRASQAGRRGKRGRGRCGGYRSGRSSTRTGWPNRRVNANRHQDECTRPWCRRDAVAWVIIQGAALSFTLGRSAGQRCEAYGALAPHEHRHQRDQPDAPRGRRPCGRMNRPWPQDLYALLLRAEGALDSGTCTHLCAEESTTCMSTHDHGPDDRLVSCCISSSTVLHLQRAAPHLAPAAVHTCIRSRTECELNTIEHDHRWHACTWNGIRSLVRSVTCMAP